MNTKIIFFFLIVLSVGFLSCSDTVDNSITFQNLASNDVFVNFRGSRVEVPNGSTVILKEIDKGEFEYETIYEIPAGTTGSSVEGEGAGTIVMDAGIKVLVVYTSTFIAGEYILYVSVTTSADQTTEADPNPIGP
ncbi:MAG: hypothetical protein WBQ32_01330 [Ignavibacteriaceae bacterium]